jgi:5-aminolevulinate synthase
MDNYINFFTQALQQIHDEQRYRTFIELQPSVSAPHQAFCPLYNSIVTIWSSNDYLNMGKHPQVIAALTTTASRMGVGAGGTRNIAGTSSPLVLLEHELAALHSKEAALLFGSGYMANQATLGSIGKIIPDCVIFSDQDNHASIIYGIRESRLEKQLFRHNDLAHLELLLQQYPLERPKLIVFESIYSMSGDLALIAGIIDLATRYKALTYIDEVHSVGLYGDQGAGIAAELGFAQEIDIIQGTLGKAYGIIGGYIAGRSEIIDSIRSIAAGLIFSTALPPSTAAAGLASVQHLRHNNDLRTQHQAIVARVRQKLLELQLPILPGDKHIILLLIGDAAKTREISKYLLEKWQIYVVGINFPTVPRGEERIRITPTPAHASNPDILAHFCTALADAKERFSL